MKLGQTISAQDFSKYAPRGLQVQSLLHPVTLYYDLKLFNNLGNYSDHCKDFTEEAIGSFIPGFIFHIQDYGIIQHLGVAWTRFETNEYVISKLPTKLLKRTPL